MPGTDRILEEHEIVQRRVHMPFGWRYWTGRDEGGTDESWQLRASLPRAPRGFIAESGVDYIPSLL